MGFGYSGPPVLSDASRLLESARPKSGVICLFLLPVGTIARRVGLEVVAH